MKVSVVLLVIVALVGSSYALKWSSLPPTRMVFEDESCLFCASLVSTVERWLQTNTTVEEMEDYLVSICEWMPSYRDMVTFTRAKV
jgi:hypothetical protein